MSGHFQASCVCHIPVWSPSERLTPRGSINSTIFVVHVPSSYWNYNSSSSVSLVSFRRDTPLSAPHGTPFSHLVGLSRENPDTSTCWGVPHPPTPALPAASFAGNPEGYLRTAAPAIPAFSLWRQFRNRPRKRWLPSSPSTPPGLRPNLMPLYIRGMGDGY